MLDIPKLSIQGQTKALDKRALGGKNMKTHPKIRNLATAERIVCASGKVGSAVCICNWLPSTSQNTSSAAKYRLL